jgi:DNA-binding response OmpR family regulator
LVLLDLEMPNLDGFGVLSEIKSHPEAMMPPVIVLTSRSEAAIIARAFELGATAYALKPVTWNLLIDKISSIYRSADRWDRQ